MLGNAGSDERILIQEIFEPKLLSTFETHARVYAAGKHVVVDLNSFHLESASSRKKQYFREPHV